MDRYTILIVEDDPVIRTQLQTLLQGQAITTASPGGFFDVAGQVTADPAASGAVDHIARKRLFNICSAIRAVSGLPVIVVTSSDTEMDELNSLCWGADAFVTKPYNTAILLARSLYYCAGYPAHPDAGLCCQGRYFIRKAGCWNIRAITMELTKTEGRILYCLFLSGRPDLHTSRDH